mmetsp:Transcript_39637/g.125129  ORF Transcript_39637/g.125129 Transcript_39637/m.125129 type:complete len:357 (+) Transcript_39637:373-1443(+)
MVSLRTHKGQPCLRGVAPLAPPATRLYPRRGSQRQSSRLSGSPIALLVVGLVLDVNVKRRSITHTPTPPTKCTSYTGEGASGAQVDPRPVSMPGLISSRGDVRVRLERGENVRKLLVCQGGLLLLAREVEGLDLGPILLVRLRRRLLLLALEHAVHRKHRRAHSVGLDAELVAEEPPRLRVNLGLQRRDARRRLQEGLLLARDVLLVALRQELAVRLFVAEGGVGARLGAAGLVWARDIRHPKDANLAKLARLGRRARDGGRRSSEHGGAGDEGVAAAGVGAHRARGAGRRHDRAAGRERSEGSRQREHGREQQGNWVVREAKTSAARGVCGAYTIHQPGQVHEEESRQGSLGREP